MLRSGLVLGFFLFPSIIFAQGGRGTITGRIIDPDGATIAGATIYARSVATGMTFSATSSPQGNFTISNLPAGSYDLAVPPIGFTFVPYEQKGVGIQGGQTLRLDIRLEWPFNLGTVGDDTFLTIRNRDAGVSGPAPRTPDGKPDLSGVWNGTPDSNPEPPSPLPWAAEIAGQRFQNNLKDVPSALCLPGGVFPGAPLLYKIVHTPSLLVQLFELDPHFRQVFLDGRAHPKDPDPTWQGHSVGHWEGDTLVIDTIGFNNKAWIPNALPSTETLHVIERYHRPDLKHLEIDVILDDPATLAKPWRQKMVWTLAPGEEILESLCNENNQYVDQVLRK
jgi:Carboxypeptidase regulatory-like domain